MANALLMGVWGTGYGMIEMIYHCGYDDRTGSWTACGHESPSIIRVPTAEPPGGIISVQAYLNAAMSQDYVFDAMVKGGSLQSLTTGWGYRRCSTSAMHNNDYIWGTHNITRSAESCTQLPIRCSGHSRCQPAHLEAASCNCELVVSCHAGLSRSDRQGGH
ncbi:hypothetical protein BDV10DRAFT_83107 [Aspergillus recurvatus]